MPTLKSARHHWWPECVSRHWAAPDGRVGWIEPGGTEKRLPPDQLGVIRNGHNVKLDYSTPEASTEWDFSFESEFDRADSSFPDVIRWASGLDRTECRDEEQQHYFVPLQASDEALRALTECVVSLAIRSPMTRERSVAGADLLRSSLSKRERNSLMGINLSHAQRAVSDAIGARGKFVIVFSEHREFIYGDGFFHNIVPHALRPHNPKLFVPITPSMSVLVTRPVAYMVEPKLMSVVLAPEEVDVCNHTVQVYSRQAIFYRAEKPTLDEAFTCARHLVYEHRDNPIDSFVRSVPGVLPLDRELRLSTLRAAENERNK